MKDRKAIVTWEVIYDIVDIAESIELNFGKKVADNFQTEIYSKIVSKCQIVAVKNYILS